LSLKTFAVPLARRTAIWQAPLVRYEPVDTDDLIDLGGAYLRDAPPPHIAEAARAALDRGETHYVDRLGIKPLREAIAATLARDGIPSVTADDLLVTSGAQEALFIALRALIKPGDEILVPDPGYRLVEPLAELGEGVVVPVIAASDFEFSAAAYAAAITDKTRFLLVLSPNPATCQVVAPQEFTKLLALAEQHDLVILYDAALQKGIYSREADPNFANGIPERVLLIGTVSKLYPMSGWRIGWLAANLKHLKPLRDLKQALSICSASLSQWAAVAALTGPQEWLDEQQAAFAGKRDTVIAAVNKMGLRAQVPDAAFYVWVDVRDSGMTASEFATCAQEQAHVRVTPGTEFGAAGEGFVRLSLAASWEQLDQGLERLNKALDGRNA